MAGAGLDADLADADGAGGPGVELATEAVEVGPKLGLVGVLLADLPDLAADRDRDAGRLEFPDEGGDLRRSRVVDALLLVDGRSLERSTRVELSTSMFR